MQILDNPQKIVGPLNDTLRSHQLSRPEAMFLQYVTNKEKEDEDKDEDSDEEDNVLLSDQLSNHAEECLERAKLRNQSNQSAHFVIGMLIVYQCSFAFVAISAYGKREYDVWEGVVTLGWFVWGASKRIFTSYLQQNKNEIVLHKKHQLKMETIAKEHQIRCTTDLRKHS